MKKQQTRREFIRKATAGIVTVGGVSGSLLKSENVNAAAKSKVVLVRNERAINDRNECNKREVFLMLGKALTEVTGKEKPENIWATLCVTKEDIVAIKINCNKAGFPLFAHTELVYALCESLSSVVPPNNIIIYDRSTSELTNAGFRENKGNTGVRCFGADEGGGFHPQKGLNRIVTDKCTKLINIPSLKAFGDTFIGSLFLKNHIGSLPRNEMHKCHGNTEKVTQINAKPSIKNKTMLVMCDGLRGNYKRGVPWYWSGIIMSRDPVAAEYEAIQVINEKLKEEQENPNDVPSYVKLADSKYQLGTCDPANIETLRYLL